MIIGGKIELFWKLKKLLKRWKIKQSWFIPTVLVEQDWKRYSVNMRIVSTFEALYLDGILFLNHN